MENTENLGLPYILSAQAQKHITHNEALRKLDAVVQISVENRNLTSPPTTPATGARYIVAAPALAEWVGEEGKIAAYQDGVWVFHSPQEGWLAWVSDEEIIAVYDGIAWAEYTSGLDQLALADGSVDKIGVNGAADDTNRLLVNSGAVLFNNLGAGVQTKLNKNAPADTASFIFQTGFSGRAEFGTTGDDDFHLKVSPDGSTFHEAMVVDKSTGRIAMPKTPTFILSMGMRYYCYADKRWVTSSDDNYGTGYYQAAESGGLGIDPVIEWEHIGHYLSKGTRIHSIHQVGRANSSQITDIEIYYLARYPSPISRWESGMDNDSEDTVDNIHRDFFFAPLNGGNAFTGDMIDTHRRKIEVDFVMPEDGFFSCYLKPTGTMTATRYFLSTLTIECSL